jgi:hypothetical protein
MAQAMKIRLISICLTLMVLNSTTVIGVEKKKEIPPAKRKDIIRLIEVTGANMMAFQIVEQIKAMYHEKGSSIPDSFWENALADEDIVRLVSMLVPVYDRHFTHKEIKELIKFYSSPIGEKMLKATPQVIRDSIQVGNRWGMEMHKKIKVQLEEKGLK